MSFKALLGFIAQGQSTAGFDASSWTLPWGMACLWVWGPFHPLPSGVYPGSVGLGLLPSPFLNSLPPPRSSLIFPVYTMPLDLRGQGPQDHEGCCPARELPSAGSQSSMSRVVRRATGSGGPWSPRTRTEEKWAWSREELFTLSWEELLPWMKTQTSV